MEKTYDPRLIETRWYEQWEKSGHFAPSMQGSPYCIMIPPPNVTGSLHMGHAFQDTLMDALIRHHRMRGMNTLWQAGTDHAGIATQMVVERLLGAQGVTRHDLGRDRFVERVWEWKRESGGTITRQLRRMGASLDWATERFTMDEGLSAAVREVFVRLYREGLIYRGKRLVNWDPILHTAVSDLEVLSQEEAGHLWHIRYPLASGAGHLVVATTRPETLLGDCAVAVHPGDERYAHLVGERVELPLTGRRIPILADEYVDPAFGTGCVKITPAHDFNDYQVWTRHRDEAAIIDQPHGGLINVMAPDASIRSNTPEEGTLIPAAYCGLDRYEARKRLVADLDAAGLLERVQEHRLMVPRGDRTNAVIEPLLTDQWFVRAQPLAEPAIAAVETGRIRFVPDNWKNTYFDWMRNIQDWCISRQIWWGHRIPAWYDAQGNVYVGRTEEEVRATHGFGPDIALRQDEDVLDTWFSSALWPFSTLGWPERTERLRAFYPGAVLVTGFDIIFFWVARMIMMGLKFMGDVPFREVYVHGLVRDSEGQKMSKSKGNVLDPLDLIDGIDLESLVAKRTRDLMQPHLRERIERLTRDNFPDGIPAFGTDTLRFTFASVATQGRDVRFDAGRVGGYRNFCNKLWNAARYVLMSTEGKDIGDEDSERRLTVADRWILSRLQEAIRATTEAIGEYRFDLAAQAIYRFTWDEYCDWYLELTKPTLNDESMDDATKRGTRHTLLSVLETLLRLAHPIIPFITEEIWQRVAPRLDRGGATIGHAPWPEADATRIDPASEGELGWLMQVILAVRNIKGEMNVPIARPVTLLVRGLAGTQPEWLERGRPALALLARAQTVSVLQDGAAVPESATAVIGNVELFVPLSGLIDRAAELARLDREMERLQADVARIEGKLGNAAFVAKAPAELVARERERLENQKGTLDTLAAQRERIARLG